MYVYLYICSNDHPPPTRTNSAVWICRLRSIFLENRRDWYNQYFLVIFSILSTHTHTHTNTHTHTRTRAAAAVSNMWSNSKMNKNYCISQTHYHCDIHNHNEHHKHANHNEYHNHWISQSFTMEYPYSWWKRHGCDISEIDHMFDTAACVCVCVCVCVWERVCVLCPVAKTRAVCMYVCMHMYACTYVIRLLLHCICLFAWLYVCVCMHACIAHDHAMV